METKYYFISFEDPYTPLLYNEDCIVTSIPKAKKWIQDICGEYDMPPALKDIRFTKNEFGDRLFYWLDGYKFTVVETKMIG